MVCRVGLSAGEEPNNARTEWPVRYVRTGIEGLVLLAGYLLGVRIGWGTAVFALSIGPAMSLGLRLYGPRR